MDHIRQGLSHPQGPPDSPPGGCLRLHGFLTLRLQAVSSHREPRSLVASALSDLVLSLTLRVLPRETLILARVAIHPKALSLAGFCGDPSAFCED